MGLDLKVLWKACLGYGEKIFGKLFLECNFGDRISDQLLPTQIVKSSQEGTCDLASYLYSSLILPSCLEGETHRSLCWHHCCDNMFMVLVVDG